MKLVIFDLDGTILDTLEDLTDAVNHALEVNGFPARTIGEVRNFVGNGLQKLAERAVPEGTSEESIDAVFRELAEFYSKNSDHKTKPYDGVIELMDCLKKQGLLLAVNSNKNDAVVQELVRKYYGNRIDYSVGALENVPKKPAPDGVFRIMEHFQVEREDVIFVGDSNVDVQTAANANLNAVIVDWGFRDREFLEKYVGEICEDLRYTGEMCIVSSCEEVFSRMIND